MSDNDKQDGAGPAGLPSPSTPTSASPPKAAGPSRDRWVKFAFLVVALAAAGAIYLLQRKNPEMPGWGADLKQSLAAAAENDKKVVVVFTNSPMSKEDRDLVTSALTRGSSRDVLIYLKYPCVHLTAKANQAEMDKYKVRKLPTVLLLDSAGREVKRREGFMTNITFCTEFLEKAASDLPAPGASAGGR